MMSPEEKKKPQDPGKQNKTPEEKEEEEDLDEALDESFPASDPISPTRPKKRK